MRLSRLGESFRLSFREGFGAWAQRRDVVGALLLRVVELRRSREASEEDSMAQEVVLLRIVACILGTDACILDAGQAVGDLVGASRISRGRLMAYRRISQVGGLVLCPYVGLRR